MIVLVNNGCRWCILNFSNQQCFLVFGNYRLLLGQFSGSLLLEHLLLSLLVVLCQIAALAQATRIVGFILVLAFGRHLLLASSVKWLKLIWALIYNGLNNRMFRNFFALYWQHHLGQVFLSLIMPHLKKHLIDAGSCLDGGGRSHSIKQVLEVYSIIWDRIHIRYGCLSNIIKVLNLIQNLAVKRLLWLH